jgi:hypothetical protein
MNALLGGWIPAPLTQTRPVHPSDWVFLFDGASFSKVARSEGLEGMVPEELASDIVLDIADW